VLRDSTAIVFEMSGWDLGPMPQVVGASAQRDPVMSPDGQLLATESNMGVNVWHITSPQPELSIELPNRAIGVVAFAPDSDHLLVAPNLRLWSISKKLAEAPLPVSAAANLTVDDWPQPGAPWWAVVADADVPEPPGRLRFFELRPGGAIVTSPIPAYFSRNFSEGPPDRALGPRAEMLAVTSSEGLFVWDVRDRAAPVRLPTRLRKVQASESVPTLAFSPSGRHLLLAIHPHIVDTSVSTEVSIFAVQSGALVGQRLVPGVATAAFSPDGRSVFITSSGCHSFLHCRNEN
jgi:WD40 repeat protein